MSKGLKSKPTENKKTKAYALSVLVTVRIKIPPFGFNFDMAANVDDTLSLSCLKLRCLSVFTHIDTHFTYDCD